MNKQALLLMFFASSVYSKPTITTIFHSDTSKEIVVSFALPASDCLYYDTIQVAVDHPAITLKEWHSSNDPHSTFDPLFKDQKKVLTGNFRIIALVEKIAEYEDEAFLFVTYYQKNKKRMNQVLVPLHFPAPSTPEIEQSEDDQQPHYLNHSSPPKQQLLPFIQERGIIFLVIITLFALLSACINLVRSPYRAHWLQDLKQYLLLSICCFSAYLISFWPHMHGILPVFLCGSSIYLLRTHRHVHGSATLVKKIVAVSTLTAAWVLTATLLFMRYLN